jgi:hypothetical protein
MCSVDDYEGVLTLLTRVRMALGRQLTAFEVMWPNSYQRLAVIARASAPTEPHPSLKLRVAHPEHFEVVRRFRS